MTKPRKAPHRRNIRPIIRRPPGYFAIEAGDPGIILANSAPASFDPPSSESLAVVKQGLSASAPGKLTHRGPSAETTPAPAKLSLEQLDALIDELAATPDSPKAAGLEKRFLEGHYGCASKKLDVQDPTRRKTTSRITRFLVGRGAQKARRLAAEAGRTLSAQEVAQLLGMNRARVHACRRHGELLAFQLPGGPYRFPPFQFDRDGLLPWVPRLIRCTGNGFGALTFLLARRESLRGGRYLDRVLAGDPNAIGEMLARAAQARMARDPGFEVEPHDPRMRRVNLAPSKTSEMVTGHRDLNDLRRVEEGARLTPERRLELLLQAWLTIAVVSPPGISKKDPLFKRIRALEKLVGQAKPFPTFPFPAGARALTADAVKPIISDETDFTEYLRSIPKGPDIFERIGESRAHREPLPKGEAAKLIREGRRRKRVLLPDFAKMMAKKTVGNTQDDLAAVRGDR